MVELFCNLFVSIPALAPVAVPYCDRFLQVEGKHHNAANHIHASRGRTTHAELHGDASGDEHKAGRTMYDKCATRIADKCPARYKCHYSSRRNNNGSIVGL